MASITVRNLQERFVRLLRIGKVSRDGPGSEEPLRTVLAAQFAPASRPLGAQT